MHPSFTVVFFFSSRRRHTRWTGDWSSDVCSSDLDLAYVLAGDDGVDTHPRRLAGSPRSKQRVDPGNDIAPSVGAMAGGTEPVVGDRIGGVQRYRHGVGAHVDNLCCHVLLAEPDAVCAQHDLHTSILDRLDHVEHGRPDQRFAPGKEYPLHRGAGEGCDECADLGQAEVGRGQVGQPSGLGRHPGGPVLLNGAEVAVAAAEIAFAAQRPEQGDVRAQPGHGTSCAVSWQTRTSCCTTPGQSWSRRSIATNRPGSRAACARYKLSILAKRARSSADRQDPVRSSYRDRQVVKSSTMSTVRSGGGRHRAAVAYIWSATASAWVSDTAMLVKIAAW